MSKKISFLLFLICIIQYLRLTNGMAVMSVDLGSEFMKIAIVKPGVPMEIVLNKESRRKTPVAISLRSIEREFGEPAMSQAIKYPKTAYLYLKDLLGKSINNPLVKSFHKKYPYYNIKEDELTKTIYFQHDQETTYTPEELIGMILENARELASDFAEQPIDAAVITVPPYFNQAERKALLRAADLANLKVLQLINSNTAAALNYGVFRRKDFNATGTVLMFVDIGATGTVATVAQYQMIKTKDDTEANPQLTIRGVGFDRSLGGNEFTSRLMQHLAKKFKEQKKKDIFDHPKAILKLYKEAERVKNVLSANLDHFAQVEGLVDEIDFKLKVTREELETICSDLYDRIRKPIEDAVKTAGVNFDEIQAVVLMGGATRMPKIQDELLKITGKSDLSKNLNTDEAAALGAVYQAAYQSKGYKVKKFYIKDVNIYPIVVDFERHISPNEETSSTPENKLIRRTLFDRNNAYPQKKLMTFNKHDSDFKFYLNYGDLTYFEKDYVNILGSLNITQIELNGVKEAFEKHKDEESKGIKVHFHMDDSGVLKVDKIDVSFEKTGEEEESESTLSKIGNKISSFFSSNSETDEKIRDEETPKPKEDEKNNTNSESEKKDSDAKTNTETKSESESEKNTNTEDDSSKKNEKKETESKNSKEKSSDNSKDQEKKAEETTATNATASSSTAANLTNSTDNANKNDTTPKPPKILKETLGFSSASLDLADLDETLLQEKRKRLELIKEKELEKRKRASAINNLEAFIYDTKYKFEETEFEKASTSEERENIIKKLDEASEWLSEADDSIETKLFTEKLSELKNLTKDVYYRVKEKKLRPKRLEELKEALNVSSHFLANIQNLTGEDKPFTEVELTVLEKLINTTKDWRVKMLNEQAKVLDHETPKLLNSDILDKIDSLKREVNYLITKAKYFKPKAKPKATESKANATKTTDNSTKTDEKKQDEQGEFSEEENKKFEEMFSKDAGEEDGEEKTVKRKPKVVPENENTYSDEKLELDDGTTKEEETTTANPEL